LEIHGGAQKRDSLTAGAALGRIGKSGALAVWFTLREGLTALANARAESRGSQVVRLSWETRSAARLLGRRIDPERL